MEGTLFDIDKLETTQPHRSRHIKRQKLARKALKNASKRIRLRNAVKWRYNMSGITNAKSNHIIFMRDRVMPSKRENIITYLKEINHNSNIVSSDFASNANVISYNDGVIIEFKKEGKTLIDLNEKGNLRQASKKINFDIVKALSNRYARTSQQIENEEAIFKGTNMIFYENKIYLIKDFSSSNWTVEAAKNDLREIRETIKTLPKLTNH